MVEQCFLTCCRRERTCRVALYTCVEVATEMNETVMLPRLRLTELNWTKEPPAAVDRPPSRRRISAQKNSASRIRRRIFAAVNPPKKSDIRIKIEVNTNKTHKSESVRSCFWATWTALTDYGTLFGILTLSLCITQYYTAQLQKKSLCSHRLSSMFLLLFVLKNVA